MRSNHLLALLQARLGKRAAGKHRLGVGGIVLWYRTMASSSAMWDAHFAAINPNSAA